MNYILYIVVVVVVKDRIFEIINSNNKASFDFNHNFLAMNSASILYGGDEIGALVFDPGHQSLRLGFAQVIIIKNSLNQGVNFSEIF